MVLNIVVGSFLPTYLFSAHGNSTKSGKRKTNDLKSAEVLREEERQQTATPYRRHRLLLDHGGGGVRHGAALLLGVVRSAVYLSARRSFSKSTGGSVPAFSRSAGGVEVKSAPSLHVHTKKKPQERENNQATGDTTRGRTTSWRKVTLAMMVAECIRSRRADLS